VSKSFYDLLELPRTASADEIKRAFRREIAKYHPDKVQHLGPEFQEIAAAKAAELTTAYKTLSDPAQRTQYDGTLDGAGGPGVPPPSAASGEAPVTSEPPAAPPPPEPGPVSWSAAGTVFAQERAGATNLIERAAIVRFKHAVEAEFGRCDPLPVPGFEIGCVPRKAGLFSKTPPRLLARFVPRVNGASVVETWAMAAKTAKDPQRDLCVFLMGPAVAPAGEVAVAIAEQRQRTFRAGGKLILVPVNPQNGNPHGPPDAPAVVKSLLARTRAS
jgi:hypothetical protein